MHMSLDGYVAKLDGAMDWTTMNDDEVGEYLIGDLMNTVDTMLLGRNLYQGFEGYWPAAAISPDTPQKIVPFARWVDEAPKIVFSKTLRDVKWKNSRLAQKDPAVEVALLKKLPGKDIVIFGGAGFSASMVELGLIDEYRIKLEPVVLGNGIPLFKNIKSQRKLKLIQAKSFQSGVVGLYYQSVPNP